MEGFEGDGSGEVDEGIEGVREVKVGSGIGGVEGLGLVRRVGRDEVGIPEGEVEGMSGGEELGDQMLADAGVSADYQHALWGLGHGGVTPARRRWILSSQ